MSEVPLYCFRNLKLVQLYVEVRVFVSLLDLAMAMCRGTSLIRNSHPPRTAIGP